MEYPPNNSTNGSKTTLFDNVRACQTTLLADINEFDAKEDSMTYMTMVLEKLQPKLLLDLFTSFCRASPQRARAGGGEGAELSSIQRIFMGNLSPSIGWQVAAVPRTGSDCRGQAKLLVSEYPPNNSTNGSKTTLFDNVRACQTTLLADINEFDAKEDSMTYMTMVLEKLQPKLLLDLFTCALLERKILLVSKSYTMLTATASVIKSLLYPLKWSNVCIAVLPRSMLETLECPTPFIMGIHSSYAFKRDFPFVLDLVVVNLDLGTLTQQQELFLFIF